MSHMFFELDGMRIDITASGSLSVGRLPDNDLVLDSAQVSRRHALLRVEDGNVQVVDLHSLAGTRVNGARLPAGEWLSLRVGDRVEFADVDVVVRAEGVPLDSVEWDATLVVPTPF